LGRYKKGYLGPTIEAIRERCKVDLRYLCTEVLGYKRWSSFHDDLAEFLKAPGRNKLILEPRGHQKTSIITIGWATQQILADPDCTNTIISATWNLSRGILREIQGLLTDGSDLPKYFGAFKTRQTYWTREAFNIQQKKQKKNPTFMSGGVDTGKTGSHCRNLIFDDIVAPENVTTKEQIQKTISAYRDCLPLLDPGGKIVLVGTRYAIGDIYGMIMEQEMRSMNGHFFKDEEDRKNWRRYMWPVASPNKELPEDSLGRYDVHLRQAMERGEDGSLRPIFPEAYLATDKQLNDLLKADPDAPFESLETVRRTNASWKWSGQYMNDPVDQEAVEFKTAWFRPVTEEHKKLFPVAKRLLSLDPAFRLKQHNDFSGLTLTYVLPTNDVCVVHAQAIKVNPERLVAEVFRLYEMYKFDLLIVESTQAQLLLANLLRIEMKRKNRFFLIHEAGEGSQDSKPARIRGLIPRYANHQIYHSPGLMDLEAQLSEFPRNAHDDIIDALAYQVEHWIAPSETKAPPKNSEEYSWDWWKNKSNRKPTQLGTLFNDLRRRR
jgi:predicted phage terminase large subunit-like protein